MASSPPIGMLQWRSSPPHWAGRQRRRHDGTDHLVAPGQVWGDRVNALDLRFAKILRFGRVRYNVGVDIINVTNSNAILTYNQNFNPAVTTGSQAWLAPTVGPDAALREDRRADRLLSLRKHQLPTPNIQFPRKLCEQIGSWELYGEPLAFPE